MGLPLLALYVGYVFIATFYPFVLSANSSTPFTQLITELLTVKAPSITDLAQNISLFIPFGALVYCSLEAPSRSQRIRILFALVVGGALSLSIEIGQIFFTRHPALSDVLANSLGAVCGALLMRLCPPQIGAVFGRSWERLVTSKLFLSFVLLFGAVPLTLSIVEVPWPNFRTWSGNVPFQIANEATLDRPWLGRIYLVALYKRALSDAEIARHFQSGSSSKAIDNRVRKGLVALYAFNEDGGDIVRDVSGVGAPLDLVIAPESHVQWLGSSNGIEVAKPAVLTSRTPASKLAQAFRGGDEISIEAWFTPANLTQTGPARLASFSGSRGRHNFILGQEGAEVVFRLNTLISGRGGSPNPLVADERFLLPELSHIVATYERGIQRMYLNGIQQSSTLDVTKDLITAFATRRTAIAQVAYSFFYFFPVSLLVALFMSSRLKSFTAMFLTAMAAGAGLAIVTEGFQGLAFNRVIDSSLVAYATIMSAAGSLLGIACVARPIRAVE